MTVFQSFPGPDAVVDSLELRRDLAGLIVRDAAGNPRAGVFPRTTAALVTATGTVPMTVNVGTFEAALVREGGPLFMQNDGTVAVNIATAPVANSRIDVIYVKQNESAAPMSDANNNAVIGVVAGTAAASPVKPTLPDGALELATVLVPSGVTATNQGGVVITQTAPYTAATGGQVWFRNATEEAAWTPIDGSRGYRLDVQSGTLRRNGGWSLEHRVGAVQPAVGTVTILPTTIMRRDAYGMVTGQAGIQRTTANGGITDGTSFAVMEGGFRPSATILVPAIVQGSTSDKGIVRIESNGVVTFFSGAIPANAQSFYFPISYLAA